MSHRHHIHCCCHRCGCHPPCHHIHRQCRHRRIHRGIHRAIFDQAFTIIICPPSDPAKRSLSLVCLGREHRGEFCSVDVAEAERRPIIVCLNSNTKIVCQKWKLDLSVEILSLYEEYQNVRRKTQNNWHLKSVKKDDDFFCQQKSTEIG